MGNDMIIKCLRLGILAFFMTGCRSAYFEEENAKRAERDWIVGAWRSYKLDCRFAEWQGVSGIELQATAPDRIGLYLVSAGGKRYRAGDSEPSIMNDKTIAFGPVGSALIFKYKHSSDDVLILDLEAAEVSIKAELRREKKERLMVVVCRVFMIALQREPRR